MHWHDQRVQQSMEGRKVEHRGGGGDHLHRHRDQYRDQQCDQLVHYGKQRSVRGGEKQNKKKGSGSRTEKKQIAWQRGEIAGQREQQKVKGNKM